MRTGFLIAVVVAGALLVGALFFFRAPKQQTEVQATPLLLTNTPMSTQPIAQKVNVALVTNKGTIQLELDGTRAPVTVGNFVALAQKGFYNGTTFHRVIPDFMIQGGDLLSKDPAQRARHGTGGPGYEFADEINSEKIVRGTVAMANAGPNTNGSQFFIVTTPATPNLDGRHTNFGKVTSGMDTVDAISHVQRDENDNPLEPVIIQSVTVNLASQ